MRPYRRENAAVPARGLARVILARLVLLTCLFAGCTSHAPARPIPVAATAIATGPSTVEIRFTAEIDPTSIDPDSIRILAPFERPISKLRISRAAIEGEIIALDTDEQRGGTLYSVHVGAIRFLGIEEADAPAQVNFRGFGRAPVTILLDARGFIPPERIDALVTVDPSTGEFSEALRTVALEEDGSMDVFRATIAVSADPDRTFAVRAVGSDGREAGQLRTFAVTSTAAITVVLTPVLPPVPEFFAPDDPVVGDGYAPVRILFDDRYARELTSPEIRSSLNASGRFDLGVSRLDTLSPVPEQRRVYETTLHVAVDPRRTLTGRSPDDFPYVAFLVEAGEDLPERGATFEVKTEAPQVIVVPVGNPALVPVRFRVDVKEAILEPDLRLRRAFPGEGIFLTGEFPSAEDALGRLAADAFSGGERATLEMRERPDAPGIFEKTIFMPPNRPYGWKVVRCPTGVGCAELNRRVVSSGRAFPTVMKNLVTANIDAAQSRSVRLIDPRNLDRVELESGDIADYSSAHVSTTGDEPPSTAIMFKQEAPDLVVTVGTTPVTTPIFIVGTWRDVNIPEEPADIIRNGSTLDLSPFDYDDGTQGRFPLVRELSLPDDPEPSSPPPGEPLFLPSDGVADRAARALMTPSGRLPLWVGWNERELYVATTPASIGRDHFIVVSVERPTEMIASQWAKAGQTATEGRQVFLAMEGNGTFQGWFRRSTTGTTDVEIGAPVAISSRGAALEGTIDPVRAGIGPVGDRIFVAVVAFGTLDGDPLNPDSQNPPGNGDFNVDPAEFREIELSSVRSR